MTGPPSDAVTSGGAPARGGCRTAPAGFAAVSPVVAPGLSHAQRRAGRESGSAGAVAGSKRTLPGTRLSGVLLAGLLLSGLFGRYWAGPVVALVIAAARRGGHRCRDRPARHSTVRRFHPCPGE